MTRLILRHLSGAKAHQDCIYDDADLATPLTVGRDPGCRLVFDERDDAVSRLHARLERRADGWWLVDTGSANGCYVNGQRVIREQAVQHDDRLQFGRGGPELQLLQDPPPQPVSKPTRLVVELPLRATREWAAEPSPESARNGVPEGAAAVAHAGPAEGAPEAPDAAVRVGRATVERLIGAEQQRGRRRMLNVLAVVVALAAVSGAWQYQRSARDADERGRLAAAAEQQRLALDQQRGEAEQRARELAERANLPARVKAEFAASTVMIEVAWRLTATQSGQQIYHARYAHDKQRLPAYVRLPDGSLEPLLQLEDNGGARPIGGVHSGSGFVVSDNGLVMTNRHVAAAWFAPFELEFPGVVVERHDSGRSWKVVDVLNDAPDALRRWVPARSRIFGTMGVADARTVTGRLDAMTATFANSKLRVPATLGTVSPEHDVALVKIDAAAGRLRKVDLRDSYETLRSGDPVVVLGYPGISAKSYVVTRSQDSFVRAQDVASVTDVSVNQGIVSKVVAGKAGAQPDDYYSTAGDSYEMSINSTGGGNSGGPVFDADGKVIGIFSAGAWAPGVALTRAVPIRYGLDLLDPTRAALARR